MLEFVHPHWFWALLVLLPYFAFEIFYKNKKQVTLVHSRIDVLKKVAKRNSFLKYIPLILRSIIIVLLIVSLTRPRLAHKKQEVKGKGIDIMLAIDVSGSMKAVDLKPKNRLEAAKKVANTFIDNRRNDRIGLVVFSENAFTQCPLTLDYNILMTIMDKVKINEEANGTAIGMGLAMSVARLKDSQAESKVIILITDGINNAGEIDPFTAADIAATYGIKVYTIGVGKSGLVDFPHQTRFGIQYKKVNIKIDMDTLNKIAQMTGTERARRAQNTEELKAIIRRIDELEKTEIKIENYFQYQELFWSYLLAAMILLILEFVFKIVIIKHLP
jgi:Ca-activated chloride channel homolog